MTAFERMAVQRAIKTYATTAATVAAIRALYNELGGMERWTALLRAVEVHHESVRALADLGFNVPLSPDL